MATGLVGIGVAVAAERARRRTPVRQAPVLYPPGTQAGPSAIDAELDEELAQTFPASDPLPVSHRVD